MLPDMQRQTHAFLFLIAAASVLAGCASGTTYLKPDAPWATIKRVGVFAFATPYEDKVHRQWATELFVKELQRLNRFEVVELPGPPPAPGEPDLQAAARKGQVDAFFKGTAEDLAEIFVDLQLIDTATGEILWSTRYHRGAGPDLSFRYQTPQQQLQRIFRIIARRLAAASR